MYSAPPDVLYWTHSPAGAITACPPLTSMTPLFVVTHRLPRSTTVYSSNSGVWPNDDWIDRESCVLRHKRDGPRRNARIKAHR